MTFFKGVYYFIFRRFIRYTLHSQLDKFIILCVIQPKYRDETKWSTIENDFVVSGKTPPKIFYWFSCPPIFIWQNRRYEHCNMRVVIHFQKYVTLWIQLTLSGVTLSDWHVIYVEYIIYTLISNLDYYCNKR